MTICFLGPDGSGKSTIIDKLRQSQQVFTENYYFHLKPIKTKKLSSTVMVLSLIHI